MTVRVEEGPGWRAAVERILDRATPEPNAGCWLWMGPVNVKGYGLVRYEGRSRLAHRVVAGLTFAPASVVTRHACDQPSCVNPDHLLAGSVADNVQDMIVRGRARRATGDGHPRRKNPELWPSGDKHWTRLHPEKVLRGERNGRSLLTAEDAASIRARCRPGTSRGPGVQSNTIRGLAREYGVDRTVIQGIVRGHLWR